ncbi:MAG: Zn-dependent hydrolase [Flavobacteriales bacterium]|nr:Zn-dependent hydrolase [Flavobacteriales bacterium]MCB9204388.1 Zn-dependent hydrolase [Flavobacteriales bacterium]
MKKIFLPILAICLIAGCQSNTDKPEVVEETTSPFENVYTEFTLTTDINSLSEDEKVVIPILIEAAKIMDNLFWQEAYGNKEELLESIEDEATRSYAIANYGPWDRLNGDKPFVEGVGEKPLGSGFYPTDMTKEEFEAWENPDKTSLYTFIERDAAGGLQTVWYHQRFEAEVNRAADLLDSAAAIIQEEGFKKYLMERAKALRTDDYYTSDIAWMDMTDNGLDCIIGPIENYEDKLYNYKAAHEAYVLVKDKEWSERLAKYALLLPQLQEGLPVPAAYKTETPGRDSQLGAYDVVFYAGDCNAGSKTIAVNLPNDEKVQLEKGTRRLQLKNAMRAKYDKILVDIAKELIVEDQQQHITFDAFFGNTMFHEVAHGLGIKNTINGKGTVREALQEEFSALEEGKADVLGLYMVTELFEMGELTQGNVMDNYVTFLAGIFRSVRFGASSAHGRANMVRFNYFKKEGAFTKENGKYRVDFEKMQLAMASLSELILTLQGDGDKEGVIKLMEEMGNVPEDLQADLDRLKDANIPVDVVFNQGTEVLGL